MNYFHHVIFYSIITHTTLLSCCYGPVELCVITQNAPLTYYNGKTVMFHSLHASHIHFMRF